MQNQNDDKRSSIDGDNVMSNTMDMRQTDIMVEADVEMMLKNGKVERFRLADIPCTWIWDDMSREAAEYWAALDHVSDNYKYDWMSIKSWVGSPVKENKEG